MLSDSSALGESNQSETFGPERATFGPNHATMIRHTLRRATSAVST